MWRVSSKQFGAAWFKGQRAKVKTELRQKSGGKSKLEDNFEGLWQRHGNGMKPIRDKFRFAAPLRQWRADFAWPEQMLLVEIEGGLMPPGVDAQSRHAHIVGYTEDCQKYNVALELGYAVLRYTALDLKQRPGEVIDQVKRVLEKRAACIYVPREKEGKP